MKRDTEFQFVGVDRGRGDGRGVQKADAGAPQRSTTRENRESLHRDVPGSRPVTQPLRFWNFRPRPAETISPLPIKTLRPASFVSTAGVVTLEGTWRTGDRPVN